FADPVLRDCHALRRRRDTGVTPQVLEARGRNVLELGRCCVDQLGERGQAVAVGVVGADVPVGDRSGRALVARIEHGDAIAHALRGHAEHPAQLSATEQPEPSARGDHFARSFGGKVIAPLAVVWAVRNSASFLASAGLPRARIATANSAAFAAPASPIAKVATGTPLGIWTMERSESSPFRCRVGIGTPRTGRVVLAASIPGRWAAPPAPAMMQARPRDAALLA